MSDPGLLVAGEQAQLELAAHLGRTLGGRPGRIHLHGDLGAGKTTLVRGFLRGLGLQGAVRSPTYTLIESYQAGPVTVHHLDLYRLADPEELEYLGLRDLLGEPALLFIEWPERAGDWLPPPDLEIHLGHADEGRYWRLKGTGELAAAWRAALQQWSRDMK